MKSQREKEKIELDLGWSSRSKTSFMDSLHLIETLEEPLLLLVVFRDFTFLSYIEDKQRKVKLKNPFSRFNNLILNLDGFNKF